jgi:A/G-specific adenine glycosylase
VWAGLYCLPTFETREALDEQLPAGIAATDGAAFKHVLTHKDLHLHPVQAVLPPDWAGIEGAWFGQQEWPGLGLPAPVRRLLEAA